MFLLLALALLSTISYADGNEFIWTLSPSSLIADGKNKLEKPGSCFFFGIFWSISDEPDGADLLRRNVPNFCNEDVKLDGFVNEKSSLPSFRYVKWSFFACIAERRHSKNKTFFVYNFILLRRTNKDAQGVWVVTNGAERCLKKGFLAIERAKRMTRGAMYEAKESTRITKEPTWSKKREMIFLSLVCLLII